MTNEDGYFCDICFYKCPKHELIHTNSLIGDWGISRCPACAELNAEPLYEVEDKDAYGLAPRWLYYLVVYLQNPRSKGGSYFVYEEIA